MPRRRLWPLLRLSSLKLSLWGGFCAFVLVVTSGCDNKDRFKVPAYKAKPSQQRTLYRLGRSVKLPTGIPLWSDMTQEVTGVMFREQPVKLRGVRWYRESESATYDLYFQRNNLSAARTISQVTTTMPLFLQKWAGLRFKQRIQVVLIPEPDPTDPAVPYKKKRLTVPTLPGPTVVIYTGDTYNPYLSRYGLIGTLTEASMRYLLTSSTKANPALFWRSIALPAYFRLRGTGVMVEPSYDKTSKPKYMSILEAQGSPSAKELRAHIATYRKGLWQPAAQKGLVRAASSFLSFAEDAYGRGVLALLLRQMLRDKEDQPFARLAKITKQSESRLFLLWERYFYGLLWKDGLRGKIKIGPQSPYALFRRSSLQEDKKAPPQGPSPRPR